MKKEIINRFLIALISLLVCVLVIFFKPISVGLHFFTNIFFFGNSDAKLQMFLLYFPLVLAISTISKKLPKFLTEKNLFLTLLLITMLFSTFSYLNLMRKLDFGLTDFPLFVLNGSYDTTSHLLHTHTFKPALTFPFRLMGISHIPRYGDGLTFYDYQPLLYVFGGLSLVLLMTSFITYWNVHTQHKAKSIFSSFLYALFTFGIFKALLDGGIFDYEFLILSYFLYLLLREKSERTTIKEYFLYNISFLIALLSLYFIYYFFLLNVKGTTRFFDIFVPIVSMQFFSLGLFLFTKRKKQNYVVGITLILLALYLQAFCPTYKGLQYAFKKIPPNTSVYIATEHKLSDSPIRQGTYLNTYADTSPVAGNIMKYILKYDLQLLYFPINIVGITCAEGGSTTYNVVVKVIEGEPKIGYFEGENNSHKVYSNLQTISRDSTGTQLEYLLEYKPKGCHPNIQALMSEEVYERGITKALIISQRYNRVQGF